MSMLHGMMGRPVVGAKMGTVSLLILRALVSLIAFIAVPALSTGLNGTGVTVWGTATTSETTPQPAYPRQDADYQKPFIFSKVSECVQDNNTGLMWSPSCPTMPWGNCAAYATCLLYTSDAADE